MTSYTAVGGAERNASTGLSAVLLSRGGRYPRRTLFQELEKVGFDYIISMEGSPEHYDLEELSGRFPSVRFILLKEAVTAGEQINLAASELPSPLFFVLWNDLRILHGGGAAKIAGRIAGGAGTWGGAGAGAGAGKDGAGSSPMLCTVPVIQNPHYETLPTMISPAFSGKNLKTLPFVPLREGLPTLYPFDGVGIYDRERFVRLGGFDGTLKNLHWQLMDFGFRAHLWGEEIQCTQLVRLCYDGEVPAEDSTAEESYRRFYLKNLAPVFRGDSAHIPFRRFPGYFIRTGFDPFAAWEEFSAARKWVSTNRYRFRTDAQLITDRWDRLES
jgi:hypothetical protein